MQLTPAAPATTDIPPYTKINPWEKAGQHLDSKDTYDTLPDGTKIPFPGTVDITSVNDLGAEWDEHDFSPQGRFDAHASLLQLPGTNTYRLVTDGTWGGQKLHYTADYAVVAAREGYAELKPLTFTSPSGKNSFFKFEPRPNGGFYVDAELDLPLMGMRLHRTGVYDWPTPPAAK